MANAARDENNVPTLIAASTADGLTPVRVYADPTSHRLLVQGSSLQGVVAPASTPAYVGQQYTDTAAKKIYFATGTASAADWTIVN